MSSVNDNKTPVNPVKNTSTKKNAFREGSLEAPIRHPIDWQNPEFYNEKSLFAELERVYDLCHGCRRCVSLCNSFPTLFDLVDESSTMEVDGVDKKDYWNVVDHCYLCDLCYQTKCPYTPPHEWNIDFPHLMLRAKAVKYQKGGVTTSEKILSSTDAVGKLASIPVVVHAVNASNKTKTIRKLLDKALGVHPDAGIPSYRSDTLRKRFKSDESQGETNSEVEATDETNGRVAIFATCFGNYNEPDLGEDLVKVLRHNDIPVRLVDKEQCCGMPKLELGDLASVAKAKEVNIPHLVKLVDEGWDIMAPVPSCVLMFRQELPLMFPDDEDVQKVGNAIFDPFEYLMLRHKGGLLKTSFTESLGTVSYHVACHQRVQKIGAKTRDCLQLVPDTEVKMIERCSGHDGTYGVKTKYYDSAMKIVKPVVKRVKQAKADHYGSDCPMAGRFIEHALGDGSSTEHPISLIRKAYGI
ncbi:MAG: Fe-S oxidoreductase [Gammaproteobacteria bacterium]|nr:Fe-S oxidoreductase [Gammaproteobacteria bacterium]